MNCPHCGKAILDLSEAARALRAKNTPAQIQASRENGRKGGRPRNPLSSPSEANKTKRRASSKQDGRKGGGAKKEKAK